MKELVIKINRMDYLMKLAGSLDANFEYIESRLNININVKQENLVLEGEEEAIIKAEKLIENLFDIAEMGNVIDLQKIDYALEMIQVDLNSKISELYKSVICITSDGKPVTPKTIGQKKYLEMIRKNDLIFGLGPAGTGKTYLAVAMAIRAFKNKDVNKIIITRPAIEAGESLGYLPGDLQSKVDPYLRPIYDAMNEMLGADAFRNYRDRGLIEIAPLAYMRGRTLDHAFIILDEAQNTTKSQMKMFLTRFGYGSTVVVNGDVTQVDLDQVENSGLKHAIEVLGDLEEIDIMEFDETDVVRHGLVKKIIKRYDGSNN